MRQGGGKWAFPCHIRRDGIGRGAWQGSEKVAAGIGSEPSCTTLEGKGRGVREGSGKVRGSRHQGWAFACHIRSKGQWGRAMGRQVLKAMATGHHTLHWKGRRVGQGSGRVSIDGHTAPNHKKKERKGRCRYTCLCAPHPAGHPQCCLKVGAHCLWHSPLPQIYPF